VSDADDPRLHDLSALVLRLALGEYAARGEPSLARDEVDALCVGLNLLAETLQLEREGREKAEALLRDSLHAYEHAPGMFCSLDAKTFELVKCNTTFADAVAIDKDQLFGRKLAELVPEDERPALEAALADVRRGQPLGKSDFTLRSATGVDRPVLLSASSVEDAAGRPERLRVILRDVSRERLLEEQVHQGQKMDAIGRLASGIAHDFNNILTVVIGATEQTKRSLAPGTGGPELDMILRAGERAAALTRQLLTFGRSDLANPRVHDLNVLVQEARPMLERPVADHADLVVDLVVDLAGEPLFILIDATQLTQVLLNLVFNALDAMEARGRVVVRTRRDPDGRVELAVEDDGMGMTPEVLDQACEPFFTTKDAASGAGLGLAVCYGIVKRAEGSLALRSTPGRGTTVSLLFPAREPGPRIERRPAPTPSQLAKVCRVLVVDDTDPVRHVIARTLVYAGHEVEQASTGVEAMAILDREPLVDLLVTDVVMPGMGGVELAERAWRRHGDLPVVFVSGYTGERLGEAVLDKPHVRFLQKPFRTPDLIEAVRTLLDPG